MSFFHSIRRLVTDPPPGHVFEISPGGIAYGVPDEPQAPGFRALPEGVLAISPLTDNVKEPEVFAEALAETFPQRGNKSLRPAVLILPDYATRLQVLDFDTFPTKPEEQQALVRFRMKKTVPFDIETAAVSFHPQLPVGDSKKVEVVAVLVAYEILGRYEQPLREAGYHPGLVTTSSLATLNLLKKSSDKSLLVKISGKTVTLLALTGNRIRMSRCLELEVLSEEELLNLLYPTLAYMEDAFSDRHGSGRPTRIWLCGFGPDAAQVALRWTSDLETMVDVLQSRFGTPGSNNAGVLGYLESTN